MEHGYVHVEKKGHGPAVVLLHGWGQNLYMMKFLQDHLQTRFTVLNLDLPGFGKSEEPPVSWSIKEYAAFLHCLLEEEGIQNPILIAHSFGARIAICYAASYGCRKLILTGAAGILPKRGMKYYLKVHAYKICKKLALKISMGSEDYQKASSVMKGVLVKAVNENLEPFLLRIRCETLLVWGEKDEQTPLWMGKKMEQLIPCASLIIFRKEGHFAYFYQSLRFQRVVDAFLEEGR